MKNIDDGRVKGIICAGCGYRNDAVKFEDLGEWLNKPCPDCGKILLTERQYKFVKIARNNGLL